MASELIKPFSEEEVERVVRHLPSNKSPGPDGFPVEFYKKIWPTLKDDIMRALIYFQQEAELPISWGSTHVILVPKVQNPEFIKDYRPISSSDTCKGIYEALNQEVFNRIPPLHLQKDLDFTPMELTVLHPQVSSNTTFIITDGSVDPSSRGAGAAFVIVQDTPRCVIAAGYSSWPWANAARAETAAIWMAVRKARSLGLKGLCICSDAEAILRLLQIANPGPYPIQGFVDQIHLCNVPGDPIVLCKVSKEAVRAPEVLAKIARKMQSKG
ncbi:hypothetical protein QJS10_CPB21g00718 [Acorus calamus]|uniref:RNase H type-1 domain-containing protein n=1 Tax=Acorus calamus TaxID=4465 RepID=A0AAV9C4L9_ACOCL|nr:hypothetical protein QJS10_CPB21g00718 [Acorus calamus]